MAQRALSQYWVPPPPENTESELYSVSQTMNANQFTPENISCTTEAGSSIQFNYNNGFQQQTSGINYSPLDVTTYNKPNNLMNPRSYPDISASFMFSTSEIPVSSMLLNLSPAILEELDKSNTSIDFGQPQQYNGFAVDLPTELNSHLVSEGEENKSTSAVIINTNQWGTMKTVNFPFSLSPNISEEWKLNLPLDSSTCLSDISTGFSANKCYA